MKSKTRILIVAFAISLSLSLSAQNSKFDIGLRISAMHNLGLVSPGSGIELSQVPDLGIGGHLDYKPNMHHKVRLTLMALRFGSSYTYNGLIDPFYGFAFGETKLVCYALNPQIEYQYHIPVGQKSSFFIGTGLSVGLPLSCNSTTTLPSGTETSGSVEVADLLHSSSYAWLVDIGVSVETNSIISWEVSPFCQYELNDRYIDKPSSNRLSIGLALLMKFGLK